MKHHTARHNGNILFILLVALALFAGLTYAITQAGQNVGNGKTEKASIAASEIMDYSNSVKIAVQKIIMNGCSDTDISFANNVVSGYEHSPPAPSKCMVFKSSGGQLRWKSPDPKWLETAYTGQTYRIPKKTCILNIGLNGPDLSTPTTFCDNAPEAVDLFIMLIGLKKDLCEAINFRISGDKTIPLDRENFATANALYAGVFSTGGNYEIADDNGILTSKLAYCFQANSGAGNYPNSYVFYNVLLAR